MSNTSLKRFHGQFDTAAGSVAILSQGHWVHKHATITERKLSYRFYIHSHPYVEKLVKRLIEKSVTGLQAIDTEYATPVMLSAAAKAKAADGKEIDLKEDEQIRLPDGTLIVCSGMKFRLWGKKLLNLNDSTSVPQIPQEKITVPSGTSAMDRYGAPLMLSNNTEATLPGGVSRPLLYEDFFKDTYGPALPPEDQVEATTGVCVEKPYPIKELDFSSGGAYAVYNWELFYHVPLTIALHLSKNQRFEEAQRWLHYIFDPTDDSDGPTPERFWKVRPFQYTDVKLIEEILINLSTGNDPAVQQQTINSIMAWKDAPFRPHLVARYRQSAYMFKTIMAYLDNLVAWGDSLFRQDTIETINEATQVYVLAANVLGIRPQEVPRKGSVRPQTYANLKADLTEFGNALVNLETDIPFDLTPYPNESANLERFNTLSSIGKALYFCIPRNDKILGYWDTVADRLFKIRNSLNIQGIFRQLPLFEPPIDPALLVRAAAAGLEVGAIVSGVNQPLPLVRFQFLVQKATEICQEVKSLGSSLLSTIEKEDNEALSLLRAKHERAVLGMAETLKYSQWQEATKSREALQKSLASAAQRYIYYERLLGKQESEIQIPELDALDKDGLEKMKFKGREPEIRLREIDVDIFGGDILADITGLHLNTFEAIAIQQQAAVIPLEIAATALEGGSAAKSTIPKVRAETEPMGTGVSVETGGEDLSRTDSTLARLTRILGSILSHGANISSQVGSYSRREQEWAFQSNLAAGEITAILKQLRAAQIREYIAEREWKNHQQQIRHAEEIEHFLNGEEVAVGDSRHKKTSTQALYVWMKREVKGLYSQCFQFAFDIAKKAERALQHELGNPELGFLQYGYLAGKEGLLAGEKLYMDIKRMEMSYHELNQREYELTKHVSLLQVNPQALIQLRATGSCTVTLPEDLFDMDCPGHYFRRIRSVAVSIPCVTGPYTSVNCTLTLLRSSIRKSAQTGDGYIRTGTEDERFSDYYGSLQAIVTSTAQNDSGLFETNFRDERYLPFEGSGVVSEWRLELPAGVRQFDYDTISDVILHLRYTAREGGSLLRNKAVENLNALIVEAQAAGSVRLFSIRHEFPSEWAKFKSVKIEGETKTAELSLNLREEHYPFWSRGKLKKVNRIDLFAKTTKNSVEITNKPNPDDEGAKKDSLRKVDYWGDALRTGQLTNITPLPEPVGKFTLYFNDNSMEDLWLAVAWGKAGAP
ncbi:MAG: hypothetical protein DKINENOH_04785 [bacterium]|nr:hypothetical protein [bacterium]